MNRVDWTKEYRQAPIGLIVFSIETIRKLVKLFWPILIGVFVGRGNSAEPNVYKDQIYFYGTIAIVVFVLINSFLSYWFFRFQIVENELRIKKGYLKKIRLSIPLERIQTVNIKQNIIQKVLNLVSVEIDTAGANKQEVKMIAVTRAMAEALREEVRLYSKMSEEKEEMFSSPQTDEEVQETILALSLSDVFKVGLTENHLRSFAIIMSIAYWIYSQIQDFYQNSVDSFVADGAETFSNTHFSFYFWLFISVFIFMISVLFSFIRSFIRFYELKLSRQSQSFKLSFGLLQTKEISVPMSKIQLILWHQNPLRQLLNFETLEIKQAVSGEKIKKTQAIEIPACQLSHQQDIRNAIFGETEPLFSETYKTHWVYFLRNFIIMSFLLILPTVFAWGQNTVYWITVGIYEFLLVVFILMNYWRRAFRISESQLEMTKGHVSKTIFQMQNYKIQSVKFRQNILVKARGLADIVIYTASGEHLIIPYIPEELALNVYHFLLYKIESTEQQWM